MRARTRFWTQLLSGVVVGALLGLMLVSAVGCTPTQAAATAKDYLWFPVAIDAAASAPVDLYTSWPGTGEPTHIVSEWVPGELVGSAEEFELVIWIDKGPR